MSQRRVIVVGMGVHEGRTVSEVGGRGWGEEFREGDLEEGQCLECK